MANAETLGAKVTELRKQRGLRQADAAAALGVARSTLASIEGGHDLPGRETMAALAKFYHVTLDFLEARNGPTGAPNGPQFVDDPDELALLTFWRDLTIEERALMLRMLRNAPADTKGAA